MHNSRTGDFGVAVAPRPLVRPAGLNTEDEFYELVRKRWSRK